MKDLSCRPAYLTVVILNAVKDLSCRPAYLTVVILNAVNDPSCRPAYLTGRHPERSEGPLFNAVQCIQRDTSVRSGLQHDDSSKCHPTNPKATAPAHWVQRLRWRHAGCLVEAVALEVHPVLDQIEQAKDCEDRDNRHQPNHDFFVAAPGFRRNRLGVHYLPPMATFGTSRFFSISSGFFSKSV